MFKLLAVGAILQAEAFSSVGEQSVCYTPQMTGNEFCSVCTEKSGSECVKDGVSSQCSATMESCCSSKAVKDRGATYEQCMGTFKIRKGLCTRAVSNIPTVDNEFCVRFCNKMGSSDHLLSEFEKKCHFAHFSLVAGKVQIWPDQCFDNWVYGYGEPSDKAGFKTIEAVETPAQCQTFCQLNKECKRFIWQALDTPDGRKAGTCTLKNTSHINGAYDVRNTGSDNVSDYSSRYCDVENAIKCWKDPENCTYCEPGVERCRWRSDVFVSGWQYCGIRRACPEKYQPLEKYITPDSLVTSEPTTTTTEATTANPKPEVAANVDESIISGKSKHVRNQTLIKRISWRNRNHRESEELIGGNAGGSVNIEKIISRNRKRRESEELIGGNAGGSVNIEKIISRNRKRRESEELIGGGENSGANVAVDGSIITSKSKHVRNRTLIKRISWRNRSHRESEELIGGNAGGSANIEKIISRNRKRRESEELIGGNAGGSVNIEKIISRNRKRREAEELIGGGKNSGADVTLDKSITIHNFNRVRDRTINASRMAWFNRTDRETEDPVNTTPEPETTTDETSEETRRTRRSKRVTRTYDFNRMSWRTRKPATQPSTETTADPETTVTTAEPKSTTVTTAEPQTTVTTAEPETTATTAEPETTVTTAEPETTVTTAEPETTVTTAEPETTVTTAEPTTEGPTDFPPTDKPTDAPTECSTKNPDCHSDSTECSTAKTDCRPRCDNCEHGVEMNIHEKPKLLRLAIDN